MDRIPIFISYASEDEAKVKVIYDNLTDAGLYPWLDKKRLRGGETWESVIKQEIEQSDFVLVCLSTYSVTKRGYQQKEIRLAQSQAEKMLEDDIYLIPIRLDPCTIPRSLSGQQCIDLFADD